LLNFNLLRDFMANQPSTPSYHASDTETTRRDFMVLTASALGAVGAAATAWPFIASMNPSADVLALSSIEVDLSPIKQGQTIKVKWRGMPVFIRNRTALDIEASRKVNLSDLKDPQPDDARVQKGHEQWLVMIGVCTHLGCIPLAGAGEYNTADGGGWFCPCHGSHYDTAGRVRKGPAPRNLEIPAYSFLSDNRVKIG
jgi:ubiquinol-cytochrome c reductase iron-sulfur subunit